MRLMATVVWVAAILGCRGIPTATAAPDAGAGSPPFPSRTEIPAAPGRPPLIRQEPRIGQDPRIRQDLRQALHDRFLPVLADGSGELQNRRLEGEKAPDVLETIVLMCDFSDSLLLGRFGEVPGDFPAPRQSEIYFTAHDSLYFDHLLGDVALYFSAVSGGKFDFRYTIHPAVVNLPHPMSRYGNDPQDGEQPFALAAEVVAAVDAAVDFSLYDTVMLVHAGAGEETDILGDSPEQIFTTYLDPDDFTAAQQEGLLEFPYLPGSPEGARITQVLILPETEFQDPIEGYGGYFGSLGVYCFEVGLRLGMLSLSDFTPAGRPDSQGIGEFGLMGYGLFVGGGWIPPHPCAFNKMLMGWTEPQPIDPFALNACSLTPAEESASLSACVRVDISGQEYWLLEYRLQDTDGNRIFSFTGDRNGNNVPDFYDFDSPTADGVPPWGEKFDAATDTLESLTGAEWDFFMSENAGGVKAGGSGVYIWHVDEGVIRSTFASVTNLFNADPARKSVDLEEADGIQDLDSSLPSEFMLGGNDDSFRGEGAASFGPFTLPGTETATGAFTGVRFADFSDVVRDSTGYVLETAGSDTLWGIAYADTVRFRVWTETEGSPGPALTARLTLPVGTDLRGSHVLVGDLQGADTPQEIILAGQDGTIFVLGGELAEVLDHDDDPATIAPFAVARWQGDPVQWNQPAALGDVDGDGEPEIVLTASHGLYAFDADGSGALDQPPGFTGLFAELPACALPPILAPIEPSAVNGDPTAAVAAVVVVQEGAESTLREYILGDPLSPREIALGPGQGAAGPVRAFGDHYLLAMTDTAGQDSHRLVVCRTDARGGAAFLRAVPLTVVPARRPLVCGILRDGGSPDELRYVMVAAADAGGQTVLLDADMAAAQAPIPWTGRIAVVSAFGAGGAFLGEDLLGRIGTGGDWLDGWPRTVAMPGGPSLGGPLVGALTQTELPTSQYIFPAVDGRIFALGARGEQIPGWPLAGPAAAAGTPALGNLAGGDDLDLVAVGTFERISGLDDSGSRLAGLPVSTVMVWTDVALEAAPWPMAGGGIWRDGAFDPQGPGSQVDLDQAGGLVSGSHECYPNPLHDGPLFVRGRIWSSGQARAFVYDLAGELIRASDWRTVAGSDPFTLEIPLDGVVTGMYICRLAVQAEGGTDQSVIPFAVVR